MKKRFASAVGVVSAIATLLGATAVTSTAQEVPSLDDLITTSYDSQNGNGMTFEKVSHPTKGLSTTDGVVDYVGDGKIDVLADGEGDRGQSYSYAAQSEGDWVYIGTMYGGLGVNSILNSGLGGLGLSKEAASALIDAMYAGHMYKGEPDGKSAGGVLFKFNVKTGETKILMSQSEGIEGGKGIIPTFRSAYKMNGKIYFVGMIMDTNNTELTPIEIQTAMAMQNGFPCVYEVDPNNGDKLTRVYDSVDVNGFRQLVNNRVFTSTRAIGSFGDTLIAGDIKPTADGGNASLVASRTPEDPNSWTTIADMTTFDNLPAVKRSDVNGGGGIYQVQEYNGKLYVVICTGSADTQDEKTGTKRSFAIYVGENHGSATNAADWSWRLLAGDTAKGAKYFYGLDPERVAAGACTLQVYGDYLYIGDYNDVSSALQGFATHQEFVTQATNLKQSINLYRMSPDEQIEMLVGDATAQFPEGGSTGLGSGFDNHMNQYTWQTAVHEGKMYLSTMNTTTLLEPMAQFTNGDILHMSKQEWMTTLNAARTFLEIILKQSARPATLNGGAFYSLRSRDARPSTDDPQALVDWALKRAQQNAGATDGAANGPTMFSLRPSTNESDAESVTLSDDQRAKLVEGIKDGSIVPDSLDDAAVAQDLYRLNDAMAKLAASLEDTASQDFADAYAELVGLFDKIKNIPAALRTLINALLKFATVSNFKAFFESLPYLKDSKRGFNLFEITDNGSAGVTVNTVSDNGFGDPFNHGLRIFAPTDDYLLIGTANPFYGTQLWRVSNKQFAVRVDATAGGTASADPATAVTPGETVQLTATADDGYQFTGWNVIKGDIDIAEDNTFVMPGSSVRVEAQFEAVSPEPVDPSDPSDPDNPGAPGDSGDHGASTDPAADVQTGSSAGAPLASTGASIVGVCIAAGTAALLALGLILARRRRA
ncbi:InlB B-repeat-containing protein [Bifidobacterium gallicum]|nr:hypothetical protein [Bifidobacterium gallicum]